MANGMTILRRMQTALTNLCNFTVDETGHYCTSDLDALQYEGRAVLAEIASVCKNEESQALLEEVLEQARLNGMGAEREARMQAQIEELTRQRDALAAYANNLQEAAAGVSVALREGLSVELAHAYLEQAQLQTEGVEFALTPKS